jgi:predicted O-methyltransferase YrrM
MRAASVVTASRMVLRYVAVSPIRPRETKLFFRDLLNFLSAYGWSPPHLKEVPLHEVVVDVEKHEVRLRHSFEDMCLPYGEAYVLAVLTRELQPRSIFEIGTYTGASTLLMAEQSNSDCQIYTLDLPPGHGALNWPGLEGAAPPIYEARMGARFKGTPQASKITQLYGDSMAFDFSPYAGKIDMVLVDAVHSYENVRRDTSNALKMLSASGTIIWDDCSPDFPGVVRALEEFGRQFSIQRIKGTRFAIHSRRCGVESQL